MIRNLRKSNADWFPSGMKRNVKNASAEEYMIKREYPSYQSESKQAESEAGKILKESAPDMLDVEKQESNILYGGDVGPNKKRRAIKVKGYK